MQGLPTWTATLVLAAAVLLGTASSHLLRGSYIFPRRGFWFRLWMKFYDRFEYMVMRVLFRVGTSKLLQKSKFLRGMFAKLVGLIGDGEVYTLDECHAILDSLFALYPNARVGLRICPCWQGRVNPADDGLPKVTDLTFIFTDGPPSERDRVRYNKFITLERARALLERFDELGLVHTMYGGCADYIDGAVHVAICNCRRGTCIPFDLYLDYGTLELHDPHNRAVVDAEKCIGASNCGRCADVCQFDAIGVDEKTGKTTTLPGKCMGCGLCVTHCPAGARVMEFLPERKIAFYQNLFKGLKEDARRGAIRHLRSRALGK
ncbi:MAG: ATP-binding protein [Promethearchaeota archaeon]